jgi:hypothetical protein
MDRAALAGLLKSWMEGAGFTTQKQLAAAMSRHFPIDTGTLSRLLNGVERVKVTRPMLEAFAAACRVDPKPALALAGFVVDSVEWPIPAPLLGMLATWEPWELEVLSEELPTWRANLHRLSDRVRHLPVGVSASGRHNPPNDITEEGDSGRLEPPWTKAAARRRGRQTEDVR